MDGDLWPPAFSMFLMFMYQRDPSSCILSFCHMSLLAFIFLMPTPTPLLIYFFISTSSISRCQRLVIVNVCVQASVCCTPWMLSICPSFNAAPLTLHRVRTMRSALASDRKGLESRTPFLFSPAEAQNREQWLTSKVKMYLPVLIYYVGFFLFSGLSR